MEDLMLDIMYELPERPEGETYVIDEAVALKKRSVFEPA
jgi:ATP-dependent protease Clp ATPase subunit